MSTPYRRALLATQGTDFDVGSERVAIDFAAGCNIELAAVHVVVSNPEFEVVAPQLVEKAEAEAVAHLDRLGEMAHKRGVTVNGIVRSGEEPYREIVDAARELAADVIVLRRRGRHGFVARVLIGATVEAVIGHAPCDVLVVARAAQMWSRRIVAATDGSPHGDRAVAAALWMAQRCKLPVTVVSVRVHPGDDQALAEANVQRAVQALTAAGIEASGKVVTGVAHEGILQVAREASADLIVVGRRGLGTVERLLLGSTSQRVVGHAECPVLIVRG